MKETKGMQTRKEEVSVLIYTVCASTCDTEGLYQMIPRMINTFSTHQNTKRMQKLDAEVQLEFSA